MAIAMEAEARTGDSSGGLFPQKSQRDGMNITADPDLNSILFCPTTATLKQGDHCIRNYEFIWTGLILSPHDRVDLMAATQYPFADDIRDGILGAKIMLLDREALPLGLAATWHLSNLVHDDVWNSVGLVAGVGNSNMSLNVSMERTYYDSGIEQDNFKIGADWRNHGGPKLFAEYINRLPFQDDDYSGSEPFINVGVRAFSENFSVSLSGVFLIEEDDWFGHYFPLPLISFSWHF